ncbi:hypothetical protein [Clostridium massiliamazoniense]|uniref:hypothetical protein n=1 Tax=Clostridium massiliamazoniense TaxID=1347366 RepID=UPI0006D7D6F2|nr:hypothetical protein [Clostridium massiliamazoniense]
MDFLEKLINEIIRLEEKYGNLKLIYENGEDKKDFDLLNLENETISLLLNTETERNMLKAIYYSYAIEYFYKNYSNEELDLDVPIGKTLAMNSVLLSLIKCKVNFRYQVESYVDKVLREKSGNEFEFLKELSDWYSVSIINKRLPYKVTMNAIHMALNNNSNLIELKKAIFIDSSMAIIATAYRFLELTEEEVRVVKCSILFSFLEDAKARRLVDSFLKEITYEYEEKDYSRSDILLKVIASFGKNKYQQFEERFRNYKVWKSTNFTNNINNFEEIMIANFNMEIVKNEEKEEIKEEPIVEEIVFDNYEEDLEATQVIDVNSIRREYGLIEEEEEIIPNNNLEIIEDDETRDSLNSYDELDENQTINEIMASVSQNINEEADCNKEIELEEEEIIEEITEEEPIEESENLEELDDVEKEPETIEEIDELKEILEDDILENENYIEDNLDEETEEENEYIELGEEIEDLGNEIIEENNYNSSEEDFYTEEEEEMNTLEGLDDLIGSLMPAEKIAERNTNARKERIKEELKLIIEAIQSTKIESSIKISFEPLNEVINILEAKNYKVEKNDSSIIISW